MRVAGPRILLSGLATADLRSIVVYTRERWGDRQARRYAKALGEALRQLRDRPGLGRVRDELHAGMRSFPVASHIVFYREIDAGIAVVRILHGSMDASHSLAGLTSP